MKWEDLYFGGNDFDTWAKARLHRSFLLQIQESSLWEKEEIPDIPLSEEQMISFVKGYTPGWDCRYVPFLLGGWIYIARSGWWLKKLKYQKGKDGFYHVTDHYTTQKMKGSNLLAQVVYEGCFEPPIMDDRIRSLLRHMAI